MTHPVELQSSALVPAQPQWHPVHKNHAIEIMAVALVFAQQAPDLVFRKLLQATEDRAFQLGLKSRQTLRSAFVIGPDGQVANDLSAAGTRRFNAAFGQGEGLTSGSMISEQFELSNQSAIYRTWNYVSWEWQSERLKQLLCPVVEALETLIPFVSLRLEYLDRFRFDGDPSEARASGVLRPDCDLLAPHIFNQTDQWHSHTGAFLAGPTKLKRLFQLHADAVTGPVSKSNNSECAWIQILTAREDRYQISETEVPVYGNGWPLTTLDTMHSELKDRLAAALVPQLVERIYLKS